MSGSIRTFLFTDVVDSTRRWADDEAGMRAELAAHDDALQRAVEANDGRVFKHTGDGVCAVFGSVVAAARAALDAQASLTLPVRMGLHCGEAEERDGDWFGPTLNLAARIMDAGHGGQVLCSSPAAALLAGAVAARPLGEFRLKGIDSPEAIFQLGDRSFPPLRARPAGEGLPELRTSLVGRDELLERVEHLVSGQRLVTLVGPGGVGKTSLAVAAGQAVAARFARAVFVDLAAVDAGDGIPVALAHALGVSSPTMSAIELAVGSSPALLVVDNCEHLVEDAADVVDALLAACPTTHVLATSREALELDGEQVVSVPPLSDDDAMVALFCDRAAAAGATPPATSERDAVVELCRRLDGLPLAIELAAARLGVLSLADLVARLDDRLRILGSGRRRGRDRHRTLRETIAWSHALLTADERSLYARLAVFSDWFDLDSAVAVAGGLDQYEVLDLLDALKAKSLLAADDDGAGRRYRYLESIRDHAWEALEESGETDAAMTAMVDHLGARLAALVATVITTDDVAPLAAIRQLLPLRSRALEWCVERGDIGRGAALLTPFAEVPVADARFVHGAALLARVPGVEEHPAGVTVVALGALERMYGQEFRVYRSALAHLRQLAGSEEELARQAGSVVGFMATIAGEHAVAVRMHQLLAAMRPHARTIHHAYVVLGEAMSETCDDDVLDDVVRAVDAVPSRLLRGLGYGFAATVAVGTLPHRAAELADKALALHDEGSTAALAAWQPKLAAQFAAGDVAGAVEASLAVAAAAARIGERSALVPVLSLHALALKQLGDVEGAATVRGVLPKRWALFYVDEREELDEWLATQLDGHQREELARVGRSMSLDDLLALAPSALAAARQRSTMPSGRAS